MDDHTARSMARTFRALADPTRVGILDALSEKEESVGALALRLSMTPSVVSHQLRLLRRMRLVRRRRQGKRVLYALDDDHIRDLFRVAREHVLEAGNEFTAFCRHRIICQIRAFSIYSLSKL